MKVVCNLPAIRRAVPLLVRRYSTSLLQRVAPSAPIADSAVHRDDVGVSHFLQVVGSKGGPESAATIKHERSFEIGILSLNVAFDDALAQVDGSGQVVGVEFAVFADVNENKFFAAIEPGFNFVNVGFTDALLGVFDNLQKARWMLSHGSRSSALNDSSRMGCELRATSFEPTGCQSLAGDGEDKQFRIKCNNALLKSRTMTLILRLSRIHSYGCYTTRPIRKGKLIVEYVGEHLTYEQADDLYDNFPNTYLFGLDGGKRIIDGYGVAAFVNHSCKPNCETDQIRGKMWIIALRDIEAGEELTYDYNLYDGEDDAPCLCGARRCRGSLYSATHLRKLAKKRAKVAAVAGSTAA